MTEPPPALPEHPPILAQADAEVPAAQPYVERTDGTLVIDLTQLVPPQPSDCADSEPDPLNPEIVVCTTAPASPRLAPQVGPIDDGFASAIPRARIKLSDTASAEANLINQGVGGFDAEGAEVRLKIDF